MKSMMGSCAVREQRPGNVLLSPLGRHAYSVLEGELEAHIFKAQAHGIKKEDLNMLQVLSRLVTRPGAPVAWAAVHTGGRGCMGEAIQGTVMVQGRPIAAKDRPAVAVPVLDNRRI